MGERLSVAAQNARAQVRILEAGYRRVRDTILNEGILPRNYPRTQNVLEVVGRPAGGVGNVALDRATLEYAENVRVGSVYVVNKQLPGVRRSGPTSSWRIPPRTERTYYRVVSSTRYPKPYPTQAAINAELERRLSTHGQTVDYRAALAAANYAERRASGFRILG